MHRALTASGNSVNARERAPGASHRNSRQFLGLATWPGNCFKRVTLSADRCNGFALASAAHSQLDLVTSPFTADQYLRDTEVDMNRKGKLDRPQHMHRSRQQLAEQWCLPPPRQHKCVVVLDGSTHSEHAVPYAMSFVRQWGASSRIILVAPSVPQIRAGKGDARARQRLREIAGEVRDQVESQVTTVEIDSRDTLKSLHVVAADAGLILMARQNSGILDRTLHGSVAHQLIRRLPCPLLLVPGDHARVNLAWKPIVRNVVIPLDGSPFAERIVGALAATGLARDAECTLTHVQDMERLFGHSLVDDARSYLHGVASRMKPRLSRVNTEFTIGFQRVAPTILAMAEQQGGDLIALATQARSGMARLFKPSVAAQIVRHAAIPILLCGPANRVYPR